jgi:hypothetical protein
MRVWLLALLVACGDDGSSSKPATIVAWYPMDDLVNGLATDVTSSMLNGMCTTCPTVEIPGHSVNAFRFDGTQTIAVAPSAALQLESMSIHAWVWLDAAPSATGCPIKKGASWHLCITPSRTIEFDATLTTAAVPLGGWHHIAATFDGTTQRVYLDGAEAAAHAAPLMFDNTGLTMGASYAGIVDDPKLYDGVLTAAEIEFFAQ